jgi:ABC-type sugar transport system substrate-binding protein
MSKKYLAVIVIAIMALTTFGGCTTNGPGEDTASNGSAEQAGRATGNSGSANDALSSYDPAKNEPLPALAKAKGKEQLTLGFITMNIQNPFFVACIEGAQAFADKYKHDLTILDGASSAERQAQGVESLIAKGCDAIDVRIVDQTAIVDSLKAARETGLDINTYPPAPFRTTCQNYDEFNMGYLLGKTAAKWFNDKFKGDEVEVACMTQPTVESVMQRRDGWMKALEEDYPNIKVVQESDGSNPDDAMTATESILQAHPNIKAVLCVNDAGALGAYEAVTQAGKDSDDFFIGGVDGDADALEKVKEGGIYRCSIAMEYTIQDLGYANMMNLANAVQGKDYLLEIPLKGLAVTVDNIDEIMNRKPDYDKIEEFLNTYPEGRVEGTANK